MSVAQKNSDFEIAFGEVLDISTSDVLHSELTAALREHKAIALCAGAVERVDAAAMQILTAAHLAAEQQEKTLVWNSVSAALAEAAARLGLTQILNLDSYNISCKRIEQADPPITAT
ncbi:MAG: STAS domain-containing protein [Gammaproteobacteria bacterium]|nr:STAS domain-containing protein [Gammaproteobacteria bacterium]